MNTQYWIIAGILLFTLLLWVFVKRSGIQTESPASSRKSSHNEDSRTLHNNTPTGLGLDLAESFFQQGEREIAHRYIDEVLEEGSEKQKEQARQLMGRFSKESSAELLHSGTANKTI
ncbi:MAG: hypothetical protein OXD44_05580 [Gammaproteobacteria bacterium]|nr:hypothetical protein [Gammaproteobacteria bacterium]